MILKDLSKINADKVDGRDVSNSANGIPFLDSNGKLSSSVIGSHTHSAGDISPTSSFNYAGSVSALNRTLYDVTKACRTSFMPPEAVTIEYSSDAGNTWKTYNNLTDTMKKDLFSMKSSQMFSFNGGDTTVKTVSTNMQIRITVEPTDRYARVDTLYCWFNNGGHNCTVDIERSTIGAKTTFSKVSTGISVAGWAGCNDIRFPVGTFGGASNQTSNNYAYRFTFKIKSLNSSYSTNIPQVGDIRMYGDSGWTTPNNMMKHDHMYDWDSDQNVTFPSYVTARRVRVSATPSSETDVVTLGYLNTIKPTSGKYFVNGFAGMTNDGVMEIGKYIDFHNTSDDANDYSTRLQCNGVTKNVLKLPTTNGELTTKEEVNTRMGGLTISKLTQAQYNASATKDANTLYIIVG